MHAATQPIPLLSTRLFPVGQGATAYALSGIAARCDWVVLSDPNPPQTALIEQRPGPRPRHVFVSMRNPFAALHYVRDHLLRRIESPFHLISGSEDCTLPEQRDKRWRDFNRTEQRIIDEIIEDPRVISWSAENLLRRWHPKSRPLPLGMVPSGANSPQQLPQQPPQHHPPRQAIRPMRMLCLHRIREGPQWDLRRRVSALCRTELATWSTVIEQEVPRRRFETLLRLHAFVICAEGGGIDPSPKAWHALLQGAIPIIRSSGLDPAYAQLPVLIVQDWSAAELSWRQLQDRQQALLPWFDTQEGRAEVLRRLSLDHWWDQIIRCSDPEALAIRA